LMRVKSTGRLYRAEAYFIVAVMSVAHLGGRCLANYEGEGGFEFWTTAGTSFDLKNNWRVCVDELLKMGDEAQRFTYQHTDLGFVYEGLADWVDIGLNYRHTFKRSGSSDWRRERRPHVNVTVKGQLGEIDLYDRSRLEYRNKEQERDQWRYTNKLTITLPYELTKWKLRPRFADQVYIDLDGPGFDRNKVYSGLSFEPSANTAGGFYYVWDSDKTDGIWTNTNILWFQLRFYF